MTWGAADSWGRRFPERITGETLGMLGLDRSLEECCYKGGRGGPRLEEMGSGGTLALHPFICKWGSGW